MIDHLVGKAPGAHYPAHMSMLTPPGMGGQYRIKGDRYPRMRRPRNRRKIVLVSMTAVLALGVGGWGTLQLVQVFSGRGGTSAQAADQPADECRRDDAKMPAGAGEAGGAVRASGEPGASPSALPKAASITVNVLNATPRTGLAARTAKDLKKRGFTIGEIANAPDRLDKKVEAPGLLMGATGAGTVARLKVLGTHLKGAETRYDDREGDDVDLVIGNDFDGLTPGKDADRAMAALASPSPKPSSSC